MNAHTVGSITGTWRVYKS